MADIQATGMWIGEGKADAITIRTAVIASEEVVDEPSVLLSIEPTDMTTNAAKRVEVYLPFAQAALLAHVLEDLSKAAEKAVEDDDPLDDYSG